MGLDRMTGSAAPVHAGRAGSLAGDFSCGILENVDEAAAECQNDHKWLRFKRLGFRRLDQPLNLSLYLPPSDWTEQ
jgi:hypothetical protein